ncbi:hypothetical protein D3C71_1401610 [compost metagenome]
MKDKYKFCISIPIHEQPEVVIDQIKNFQYFYNNEVAIVLHVSPDFKFDDNYSNSNCFLNKGVYVNGESLPVVWGTLMHVHNSNFKFASKNIDFQYFIIHSSNDMYVRHGVKDYIEQNKNGVFQANKPTGVNYLINHDTRDWSNDLYLDKEFINLMEYLELKQVYVTQCEGSFFEKKVFSSMVRVIDKFYVYARERIYPREEYWYSTIVKKFIKRKKIGKPFLLSEIWRKDGIVINEKMIIRLHNKEKIDDELNIEYPYDYDNLYAVKRVPREINHPLRILIREIIQNEQLLVEKKTH